MSSLFPEHPVETGIVGRGVRIGRKDASRAVTRAHAPIVGRYEIAEPYGVVVPEDPRIRHDIFTLRRDAPTVREGDIVRVRITAYPEAGQPAFGSIEEVVGHEGDAGIDVDLIVARHMLATCFSDDALAQAASAEAGIATCGIASRSPSILRTPAISMTRCRSTKSTGCCASACTSPTFPAMFPGRRRSISRRGHGRRACILSIACSPCFLRSCRTTYAR